MNNYIIVYDDGDSLCIPQSWDQTCEGAVCADSNYNIALFATRKAAQTAIKISRKYAELREAQGKAANTDFTEFIKFINIVPAKSQTN